MRTFALLENRAAGAWDVCSLIFHGSCDARLLDAGAWRFGIPLAGWGIVYYSALGSLLALEWMLGKTFAAEACLGALALSIIGAGVSVALVGWMLAGRGAQCPLCLVIHAVNFGLAAALTRFERRPIRDVLRDLYGAATNRPCSETRDGEERSWKPLGFVTPGLVAVVAWQWVFVETVLRRAGDRNAESPEKVLAEYQASPRHEIPVGVDDPRLGPADAPAELVIFSSFQCPGCRRFAEREVPYLKQHFGDNLRIIFKHFPLSMACNRYMLADQHPGSCAAASAAEAARRQGRFWEFHDAYFRSDRKVDEPALRRIAAEIGLDLLQFDADREAPATTARIRDDVELGERLEIDATPTLFLNGRRVARTSGDALGLVITDLLREPGLYAASETARAR